MISMVEADVRQQIDKRLAAQGWMLDADNPNRDVFVERSVVHRLGTIQRDRLNGLAPDYTFFSEGTPVAILEAKKPSVSIQKALEQGLTYADRIGVDYVFACNGPTFKSLHVPSGHPMFMNNLEVKEPLSPTQMQRFRRERSNKVITVSKQVIKSRSKLIEIFESLNNVLRQEGIRAGLDRFTEFANILFLKMLSERDANDQIWHDLLSRNSNDLPAYLNGFVVNNLRQRYDSDVLSETKIGGDALKSIINQLNPLHLTSVDEDLKGVAFEHFLSRTTATNNDLGEYFTPRWVVRFMVQLLNPQFGQKVYDPFCGTGGFLIEAFRHLGQQTRQSREAMQILHHESIHGKELTTTARIAKMNMILFGDGHSGVKKGSSLVPPDKTNLFDCVLSNIPFSLKNISFETLRLVDPAAKDADEACLLHCFNCLKLGGSMAVVLPEGLVVNQSHRELWDRIFEESCVKVIASLPRGTFAPYTDAGTKILFLTNKGTKSTIWYYDVTISGETTKGETIDTDEFLFFFQNTDEPLEDIPIGCEIVYSNPEKRKQWKNKSFANTIPLRNVANIVNGKTLTKANAIEGGVPVIGGGGRQHFLLAQPIKFTWRVLHRQQIWRICGLRMVA